MKNTKPDSENFETLAIRTQAEQTLHKEHAVPLFLTSSFKMESAEEMRALFANEMEGNVYSRYSNPNTSELIEKLCLLEKTEAGWVTASGMAAVFTTFATFLSSGDHILSCRSVFGSTHQILTNILPKWNISFTYADILQTETWEQLIQSNTKMIYVETPSNPGVDLVDLEWLGKLAKSKGVMLVVDNCFATPYLQQPALFGADVIIHSATKYIDGQGRVLGGAILSSKENISKVEAFARHSGPALSPFNAWILSKSLETLAVRMDRHCSNAKQLAEFLSNRKDVQLVKYPFLPSHPQFAIAQKQMKAGGGIVTFIASGGIERGRKFLDALKMCSLSPNLGDTRTIATHPASTTHSKLTEAERLEVGILPGLIRISVGLEHIDDIVSDIENALNCSA